jgi:hypothetical protein
MAAGLRRHCVFCHEADRLGILPPGGRPPNPALLPDAAQGCRRAQPDRAGGLARMIQPPRWRGRKHRDFEIPVLLAASPSTSPPVAASWLAKRAAGGGSDLRRKAEHRRRARSPRRPDPEIHRRDRRAARTSTSPPDPRLIKPASLGQPGAPSHLAFRPPNVSGACWA